MIQLNNTTKISIESCVIRAFSPLSAKLRNLIDKQVRKNI